MRPTLTQGLLRAIAGLIPPDSHREAIGIMNKITATVIAMNTETAAPKKPARLKKISRLEVTLL